MNTTKHSQDWSQMCGMGVLSGSSDDPVNFEFIFFFNFIFCNTVPSVHNTSVFVNISITQSVMN